jgi:CRP-like cAMP-binding protein
VVVVSGWACELRILPDGRRQIFAFMVPGDVIDERCTASMGSRGVVALTRLEVIDADATLSTDPTLRQLFAQAVSEAALEREDRLYDHVLRMGRLSARERVTHLLLELRERLDRAGLVKGDTFRIPLTQEVFADALGLSVVHINRTMKQLRQSGSVVFKSGSVTIRDPDRLAAMAQYQSPFAPQDAPPPPALAARSAATLRESADRRATA